MKTIIIIFSTILLSCSTAQEDKCQKQEKVDFPATYVDSIHELTSVQQEAFDALNTLQTNTDELNRLYSTFANIHQPFYPADTSIVITQSQFLTYMKQFVSQNCQNLSKDRQNELAKTSVLAQEEYTVLYCREEFSSQNFENGLPISGIWVLPNVLGRRDVIIVL